MIKQFGDACANLFSGFVNPIGLGKIGWRYYIVWCCVLVSNFIIIYLFFPEVSQRAYNTVLRTLMMRSSD